MTDQSRSVGVFMIFGTPTTGLWCDTCLLPSRYEAPVYALYKDGVSQCGVLNRCEECAA